MAKNKLIKVASCARSNNEYIFIGSSSIEEKDIVLTEFTCYGKPVLGIVTCIDVDPLELNSSGAYIPIKRAFTICKSTHDLSSSRNIALRTLFGVYDTSIKELLNAYDCAKKPNEEYEEDLPF